MRMGPQKFVAAALVSLATFVAEMWGKDLGIPPGWAQDVAMVVTPILVYMIPNKVKP